MKNIIKKLNQINDIALRFTSGCLGAVTLSCGVLTGYCTVLFARGQFVLKEIYTARRGLEYIIASFVLSFCFGLLIDLYLRKKG